MNIQKKKLINGPDSCVVDSLTGVVRSIKELVLTKGKQAQIITTKLQKDKEKFVSLVSGGGSGHEPAHALFCAKGMLSAAVCGHIFTSPDVDSILQSIKMVCGKAGCLLIIKNYTGDVLNFKLAAQIARNEGYKVGSVIVADDAAFPSKEQRKKRGIAGTCFVHKICGAAASLGKSFDEILSISGVTVRHIASIGVSLGPCHLPGADDVMFTIPDDEVELGLGIHGEIGVQRTKLEHCDVTVAKMITLLDASIKLSPGDEIALLINNLGGLSQLELYIVASKAIELYEKDRKLIIKRVYVGTFMTSLGMKGCSISILKLPKQREKEFLTYLDHETTCTIWPKSIILQEEQTNNIKRTSDEFCFREEKGLIEETRKEREKKTLTKEGEFLKRILKNVGEKMIDSEKELNNLDSVIGDGDCGSGFKRGGQLILEEIDFLKVNSISQCCAQLGTLIRKIGGSSGAVYGSFLLACANKMKENEKNEKNEKENDWRAILQEGCNAVSQLGGAKKGDSTFLDAIFPVIELLSSSSSTTKKKSILWMEMAKEAQKGADSTIQMKANRGRAEYVQDRSIGRKDPGAQGIANVFSAISECFQG